MEPHQEIRELFEKYLADEISEQEKTRLFKIFKDSEDENIEDVIRDFLQDGQVPDDLSYLNEHIAELFENIKASTTGTGETGSVVSNRKFIRYLLPVAAVISCMVAGIYFLSYIPLRETPKTVSYDIAPGTNGATLTLANGRKIKLNDAVKGKIADESGVIVTKDADGKLSYEIKETNKAQGKSNTLSTAAGETYMLTLPDRTKVWMNSQSSLTYSATLLEGNFRRVKLEGEAYFQVSKDKTHPFIVETASERITVLGTHFNVNSYMSEQQSKTTLVEGSVKVVSLVDTTKSRILKPNEEAVLKSGAIAVQVVDPEFATAWKDGFFMFDDENLESVMNRIARWYGVKISYSDPSIRYNTFVGTMSRYDNISKVLQVLQSTKVASFKLEGRTIVVKKIK